MGTGLLNSCQGAQLTFWTTGSCQVWGFNPFLQPSVTELSAASGGTLEWAIHFPEDAAGQSYQLLASASGTTPLSYGGITVNLTLDSWLMSTYQGNYPSLLSNGVGILDANAEATASLILPAGMLPPSMVGTTFHFAAVSSSSPVNFTYASVSQPLTFVP